MVWWALDREHRTEKIDLLISGGCPPRTDGHGNITKMSADRLAEEWARENEVDTLIRYAKWKSLGRGAGPTRNTKMAKDRARDWIVFPGGHGTADMARKAEAACCRVIIIEGKER